MPIKHFLIATLFLFTLPVQALSPTEESIPTWTKESIVRLIEIKSEEYGVSYEDMYFVVSCETAGTFDPDIQSNFLYKDGSREQSYGVAQFHIPAGNKTKDGIVITEEMAKNPYLAIDTMAWYFSMGWQRKWSCYTIKYPR